MKRKTIKVPFPKGRLTHKKILFFLLFLFCAWLVSEQQNQAKVNSNPNSIQIQRVIDGDTIKDFSGESFRLLGIDAPELAKMSNGMVSGVGDYYSSQAKKRLEQLVLNQELKINSEQNIYDTYKRRLVELFDSNNNSINEQLLAEGLVIFYPFSNLTKEQELRFIKAQQLAIKEQRGLWKKLLSLEQISQPVIANKRSKRFFPKTCADGKKIAEQNRLFFSTAKEALNAGYSPARECNFFPKE